MDARKRWQRAIIISVGLNIFLLCGLGILFTGYFKTESVEDLLELDLVSAYSSQESVESSQLHASTAVAPLVVPNMISSTPVAVQTVTSLPIGDEIQTTSSAISGSISGSSTVSGEPAGDVAGSGGKGSGKPSGGILRPQVLSQVHPTYPEAARKDGITGTVLLKVQILENGRAGDISIKQSSGNDLLDESAVAAVYKWRFTPAKENTTGRAVACYTTVPVVFRLNN